MATRKQTIRPDELLRDRYSSFVVDLRQNKPTTVNTEKTEINSRQKISWSWPKIWSFKKRTNNFSVGQTFASHFSAPVFKKRSLLSRKKSFSLRNVFSSIFKPKTSFWPYRSNWRRAVKRQQRILSSRFSTKNKRLAVAKRQLSWYRSIFSFSLTLLLLIVPIKLLSYFDLLDVHGLEEKVMLQSKAAIGQLMLAMESAAVLDFKEADSAFSEASEGFIAAQSNLSVVSDSLLFLISLSDNPKLKLAAESKKFLAAGAISASLGRNLVLATDSLFSNQGDDFLLALDNFSLYGEAAVNDAKELDKIIKTINLDNLPIEYRDQFEGLANKSEGIVNSLSSFVFSARQARELLGLSQDKRYLLIFQNNAELRASGGFLGSYALLDVSGGKIKNLEVPAGGSYDTEGGMTVKVKAPEPLWLVSPLWHFWDANWWADWPKTAKNLMWFYEKSGGSTVDGVITLTPTVVERLLEITGPVDMTAEYGIVIDSQNFWETTQKIVEHKNLLQTNPEATAVFQESTEAITVSLPLEQDLEQNVDNKPKKIIGDLMARILEILPQRLTKENLVSLVSMMESSLAEKQVMFYFTDPVLQAEVSSRNWAGEVKSSEHDYLMVVNTNIAGQKSDRKISERIEHDSQISSDGKIINTVTIYRTHNGIKREALTGVRNVNWLRLYVPAGSRLLSATGFSVPESSYFEEPAEDWLDSRFLAEEREAKVDPISGAKIYQEFNKTVFAGWVMVDPGETAVVKFSYELPFKFKALSNDNDWLTKLNLLLNPDSRDLYPYSLLIQKQPGAYPSEFVSRLYLPGDWQVQWSHPDNLSFNSGWEFTTPLSADKYLSILLKNK